jgi:hypothetical protein
MGASLNKKQMIYLNISIKHMFLLGLSTRVGVQRQALDATALSPVILLPSSAISCSFIYIVRGVFV